MHWQHSEEENTASTWAPVQRVLFGDKQFPFTFDDRVCCTDVNVNNVMQLCTHKKNMYLMYAYIYIYIFAMYAHIYIYVYMYKYKCISIYICIYIYVYRLYIYIYVRTYICIHILINTHNTYINTYICK